MNFLILVLLLVIIFVAAVVLVYLLSINSDKITGGASSTKKVNVKLKSKTKSKTISIPRSKTKSKEGEQGEQGGFKDDEFNKGTDIVISELSTLDKIVDLHKIFNADNLLDNLKEKGTTIILEENTFPCALIEIKDGVATYI
jgi:hypothetical protein